MRHAILPALLLLLSGCGEAVEDNHFAEDVKAEREASTPVFNQSTPVRIGQLGPSFPACGAAGRARNVGTGASLAVRAAPFDTGEETGAVPSGGRFFVCSRSHDQKWFGIVYGENGTSGGCGVSGPVTSRRDYEGPCRSGWVSSAFVRLIAGA
mgnify:CR=1 FL=1